MKACRRIFITSILLQTALLIPAYAQQKSKISIAYLDDPSRYAAVHAIRKGLVKSDTVDLDISFLPLASAVEAYQTKRYDLIEASSLAPALSAARGFRTLVVSVGLINRSGTQVFTAKNSGLNTPADLKGKTLSTAAIAGSFTLETRYVLQSKYGLNVSPQGGDIRFQELPPDVSFGLIKQLRVDAGILNNLPGWRARQDGDIRVLMESTKDFVELTGEPFLSSLLLTYPDVASTKRANLIEANRMLAESIDYYKKNSGEVNAEVAKEKRVPAEFLSAFFSEYEFPHGSFTDTNKRQLMIVWDVAAKLGAIKNVPNQPDDLIFK